MFLKMRDGWILRQSKSSSHFIFKTIFDPKRNTISGFSAKRNTISGFFVKRDMITEIACWYDNIDIQDEKKNEIASFFYVNHMFLKWVSQILNS